MSISLHSRILLFGAPTAGNTIPIGSFDFATSGKGGSNLDNVSAIFIARVAVTSTHTPFSEGHSSVGAIVKRISGTIIGPFSGFVDVPQDSNNGSNFLTLSLIVSGTSVQVQAAAPFAGQSVENVSGILDVYVQP